MPRLLYIYDTYCGWCYGASPVLSALLSQGNSAAIEIRMLHRALFTGANAPALADGFKHHAWSYDQRIAQLTGQPFSEAYRQGVLERETEAINSWMSAVAAAAVREQGPHAEQAVAQALQQARFVEGRPVSDLSPLIDALCAQGIAPDRAHHALFEDESLRRSAKQAQEEAASLMATVGARGVPTLLAETDGAYRPIELAAFYDKPERIAETIKTLQGAA